VNAPVDNVTQFATEFRDAVIARARGLFGTEATDQVSFREEAFTELFIEALGDAGAVTEGHVSHFERRIGNQTARVDGYYFDEEEDYRLDLFISIYEGGEVPAAVSRDDVARAVKQVLAFVQAATAGVHERMEPSDSAYSMLQRVHELRTQLRELRVFILTDGVAKEFKGSKGIRLKGMSFTVHVWDIARLSRCVSSGGLKEPIEVDFVKDYGRPIDCLPVKVEGGQYQSYLAAIPGDVLFRLYDEYSERLLELNVRSFLQARGKINKEIRRTILEEPVQFFAFNNGLTAIAEEVRTETLDSGGIGISWIRGLQIVNGGQTTASIHQAGKKDAALQQIQKIQVQVKLSVIDAELTDVMVPRISLYANSQNKVNDADFSANDPYHQKLERMSRTIWTPDGQTHWFYERARGQYQVARAREGRTPAVLKRFDTIHPSAQMFAKTDLAGYVHSWEGLPHWVSRGSQKNFREFTIRLSQSKPPVVPDENYFRELVAKAIFFKQVQTAARAAAIGAYRANIVTYTVAYLSRRLGDSFKLIQIWERQALPARLDTAIQKLLEPIGSLIVQGAGSRNVTEFCKREECWKLVASQDFDLGAALDAPEKRPSRGGPSLKSIVQAVRAATDLGIDVIDNTKLGGPLWLVAGQARTDLIERLDALGLVAQFAQGGAKATGGKPAWYIKVE
jgi:hypothetical protein